MTSDELKARTKQFALRIIRMTAALPKNAVGQVLGKQILRAGTSVGANYRAALRARSTAEFVAKLGIVVEEVDECCYWLDLIQESRLLSSGLLRDLCGEANELTAIFTATVKSAKNHKSKITNHKSKGSS